MQFLSEVLKVLVTCENFFQKGPIKIYFDCKHGNSGEFVIFQKSKISINSELRKLDLPLSTS